jgi:hypothetical protein
VPRVQWDTEGTRVFEVGVDRGMLYVPLLPGVAWNGLIKVSEAPTGGTAREFYIDGQKFQNLASLEEFSATIETFSFPPEFASCAGMLRMSPGLLVSNQPRQSFGFSYRTLVGDDILGTDAGYKLHVVYNAVAKTTDLTRRTESNSVSVDPYSLTIAGTPEKVSGFKPTSHFVVDSRKLHPAVLKVIEDALYGTATSDPHLLSAQDLMQIIFTGVSDIAMKKMSIAGALTAITPKVFAGDILLKKLQIGGYVTIGDTSALSGAPRLKKMRVAGSTAMTSSVSAAPRMKKMRVAAVVTATTGVPPVLLYVGYTPGQGTIEDHATPDLTGWQTAYQRTGPGAPAGTGVPYATCTKLFDSANGYPNFPTSWGGRAKTFCDNNGGIPCIPILVFQNIPTAAVIQGFLTSLPVGQKVAFQYYSEPENEAVMTAAQYVANWATVSDNLDTALAAKGGGWWSRANYPMVTSCYEQYYYDNPGNTDWLPAKTKVQSYGTDFYHRNLPGSAQSIPMQNDIRFIGWRDAVHTKAGTQNVSMSIPEYGISFLDNVYSAENEQARADLMAIDWEYLTGPNRPSGTEPLMFFSYWYQNTSFYFTFPLADNSETVQEAAPTIARWQEIVDEAGSEGPPRKATVRSSSTYISSTTEATCTVPLPSGWQTDDVCYLNVNFRGSSGNLLAPNGWSAVSPSVDSFSSGSSRQAVYRRVMQAGDAGPGLSNDASYAGRYAAVMVCVKDADISTPEDGVAPVVYTGPAGATSPISCTAPSITPNGATDLLLCFWGAGDGFANSLSYSVPAGMTLEAQATTSVAAQTEASAMVASLKLNSNAATGTRSSTITTNPTAGTVNAQAVTIAVKSWSDAPVVSNVSGNAGLKKMRVSGSSTETSAYSGAPRMKKMKVAAEVTATTSSTPFIIGSDYVGSGTSRIITVDTPTSAGDTILVGASTATTACYVTGIIDSRGNVYSQDGDLHSSTPTVQGWRSPGPTGGPGGTPTVALQAGDTITLTFASSVGLSPLIAACVPGGPALDQIGSIATGSTVSSLTSNVTPTYNDELLVALHMTPNAGSTPAFSAPATDLGNAHGSTSPWANMGYLRLTGGAGVQQSMTDTWGTAGNCKGFTWSFR